MQNLIFLRQINLKKKSFQSILKLREDHCEKKRLFKQIRYFISEVFSVAQSLGKPMNEL